MNHEGMEGSVIVITGGGSGMGAAMAKDFAAVSYTHLTLPTKLEV